MECSVCKVRSQIGFCKTCDRLLCEVCGIPCDRCKKLLCRTHREITPHGRNLCPECMEHRNAKLAQKQAEHLAAVEKDKAKEKTESFSFEALMADLGDPPSPSGRAAHAEAPVARLAEAADLLDDYIPQERPRQDPEDNLNTRVLAASGAQPTPVWNISIRASVLGFVMLMLMYFFAPAGELSDWMRLLVAIVAGVGFSIGIAGALQRKAPSTDRKLCGLGIGLALLTVCLAFMWQ